MLGPRFQEYKFIVALFKTSILNGPIAAPRCSSKYGPVAFIVVEVPEAPLTLRLHVPKS